MKTKPYFLSAVLALLFASCNSEYADPEVEGTVPVTIHVSDFSISVSEFSDGSTRAVENVADYQTIKEVMLAFYKSDGTEVYKSTQVKSDASTFTTFGEFSCNLPVGTYTLVAIGRDVGNNDVFVLTSPTEAAYTSERVRETYSKTQSVTVSYTSALDLTISLNRVITMLAIYSTDNRPAAVTSIRTTYGAGSKSFNPTTGFATDNAGFSLVNNPAASTVGQTVGLGSWAFLASNSQTMDITIEALDANNQVLCTKVVPNVPFKCNRKTVLRGPLFSPSATSAAFTLESDWLTPYEMNF